MVEVAVAAAQPILSVAAPTRSFQGHKNTVSAIAVFPDGRRIVMSSHDQLLLLDLTWTHGVMLKRMEGHSSSVRAVTVSRDGQCIASGDVNGKLIIWRGDTGEPITTHAICAHSDRLRSLDFSPDGTILATGSKDKSVKLWNTSNWEMLGNPINCGTRVTCVRFSPTTAELAIATDMCIEIWNIRTWRCITKLESAFNAGNCSLVWSPNGTRLLSGGSTWNPTIREWNTSTWQQVGGSWVGHTAYIDALAISSDGRLVVSASDDNHVRLWRRSDRRTIAIFVHSQPVSCVTFSIDGRHVFSGGCDNKMSDWAVPEDALLPTPRNDTLPLDSPKERAPEDAWGGNDTSEQIAASNKIFRMDPAVHNACVVGDLQMAEDLVAREIDVDRDDPNPYANRSFIRTRRGDWDGALRDARRSIRAQPTLTGYLSHGVTLCGHRLFVEAMKAFDLTFLFGDSRTTTHLLLVKAIALFNADQHQEAMTRVRDLAVACPKANTLVCRIVEAYLHVQLGIGALDDARYDDAANHFAIVVNSSAFASDHAIHLECEIFVVLFGWDLKTLWQTANQKRCRALLLADRLVEAGGAYRSMMDTCSAAMTADCCDWAMTFRQECRSLCTSNADTALAAHDYDNAIKLYSVAIDLDSESSESVFAGRCAAKLGKMLWEDALVDAEKVIELNPSSYVGYQLKHSCLHGTQRYDEAIAIFDTMLFNLDQVFYDAHTQELRRQYLTSPEAADMIRVVIHAHLQHTPHRLLDTYTGRLYDRMARTLSFKGSIEYKRVLSSVMMNADACSRKKYSEETVETYFRFVMLSHRWEDREPLLRDIHNRSVYELDHIDGITKLQSFCDIARDAGYHWAWVDTCCIDQTNNVEVQHSVHSMFVWYRRSALTIAYLSDVPPSSASGALEKSIWNTRGWTVQEFLAPKIVRFYQSDWTLYLNDKSPNHKDSSVIMQELGNATAIDPLALTSFRPGMIGAREKLQWVSTRNTTIPEDTAYSLFGIFDVHLPIIYGENMQNALGRLLQEIVAQSGDITCLDWVGKPSEFNSCLPADITFYKAPPSALLAPLSEDDMQTSISSLQNRIDVEAASRLYQTLDSISAPQFGSKRLRLPCIAFAVTDIKRNKRCEDQQTRCTFIVKTDGLQDLSITTDKLVPFSGSRSKATPGRFFLVRPWDRSPLGSSDFEDLTDDSDDSDTESVSDGSPPPSLSNGSPFASVGGEDEPQDFESHLRALRLIVRLGQPFSAFLLAQKQGGQYKRIASDQHIIAQVKDMASIHDMMDIRMIEIV